MLRRDTAGFIESITIHHSPAKRSSSVKRKGMLLLPGIKRQTADQEKQNHPLR